MLIYLLLDCVNQVKVDLVVVMGDLMYCGCLVQFVQVVVFLCQIEVLMIVVLGNYDILLYKLVDWMMKFYKCYCCVIVQNMELVGYVGNLCVQGVNSVDLMVWQWGVLIVVQMCCVVQGIDFDCINIVVLYYLMQQCFEVDKVLMCGVFEVLVLFELQGIQVVLIGYLYIWFVGVFQGFEGCGILQVQGGIVLCVCESDLQNEFVVLDFDGFELIIQCYIVLMDECGFCDFQIICFVCIDWCW